MCVCSTLLCSSQHTHTYTHAAKDQIVKLMAFVWRSPFIATLGHSKWSGTNGVGCVGGNKKLNHRCCCCDSGSAPELVESGVCRRAVVSEFSRALQRIPNRHTHTRSPTFG